MTKEEILDQLYELRNTVLVSCNPPDDCNDPNVLKVYMKACFEKAMEIEETKNEEMLSRNS